MAHRVEIEQSDLKLIIAALEDAMFYRDVRSHASRNVVRDEDRGKARAYAELVTRLKAGLREQP